MTCLRCSQLGHWAASCPQNAKGSTSPSNKRPAPSTATEGMAVHSEAALVQFQDVHGAEHPEATMLDPGASAFLSGYGPFKRYVEHLSDLGYPVNTIRFARCERLFQFGGDASSQARWTVNLPVMIMAVSAPFSAIWFPATRHCSWDDPSSRPCAWALTSVASR